MVVILKKGLSVKKLNQAISKLTVKKGFEASKFCGTVKFNEDGLAIQKALRNEWK